jgi:long-chain fatty acid transport protein
LNRPHTFLRAATATWAITAGAWVNAAGYKVPETSSNATALSAAYVANAHGPDASYYNPARMALNDGGAQLSGDLTLVHLPRINFSGTQSPPFALPGTVADDSSQVENILIPTFHYVSPLVGDARFGLSIVSPGGLSKRWEGYGARSAEEFSLRTVEINPTIGYRLSDRLAIGGGLRMLYSDGVVKSRVPGTAPTSVFRDLEGDSIDFGYNLAVHYDPSDMVSFAVTYRSRIDMTIEGDARLGSGTTTLYDGGTSVEVPLPAALAVAGAVALSPSTTLEVVFERTYWSAYDQLDFQYDSAIPPGLVPPFDDPIRKDWSDSNTIRFGLTHELDDRWTLMGGFALDESPAPPQTIGFELPESDGKIFSVGARYKASAQWEFAGGILYTQRDDLTVDAASSDNRLTGTFSDAGALLVTLGTQYSFQ